MAKRTALVLGRDENHLIFTHGILRQTACRFASGSLSCFSPAAWLTGNQNCSLRSVLGELELW